jgi:hypothetical protein
MLLQAQAIYLPPTGVRSAESSLSLHDIYVGLLLHSNLDNYTYISKKIKEISKLVKTGIPLSSKDLKKQNTEAKHVRFN